MAGLIHSAASHTVAKGLANAHNRATGAQPGAVEASRSRAHATEGCPRATR